MKECTTHHFACRCREAKFKDMITKLVVAFEEIGKEANLTPAQAVAWLEAKRYVELGDIV